MIQVNEFYSEKYPMTIDLELLNSFIEESSDLLHKWESTCLDLNKEVTPKQLHDLFRIAHNLKGGARSVGLSQLGEFIHKIEDGVTAIRDGQVPVNQTVINILLVIQQKLTDWLEQLKINPDYSCEFLSFITHYKSVLSEAHLPSELNTDPHTITNLQNSKTIGSLTSDIPQKTKKTPKSKAATNETIRISTHKLDLLIQIIGELSIQQSILWHSRSESKTIPKKMTNSIQLCQKLTKDLYDRAFSLRMQPVASLFQRLERTARDLSGDLGKSIEVVVSGVDVELDKIVLEKMVDPLTHIVRNAIDHGLENSEDRASKGKSIQGQLQITAVQDSFGVTITIEDDGKGMNEEKIKKKAIEKGLLKENAIISKDEILNLIFMPGFSTAEKITEVSGRGVGMDVVRTAVEDLQGKISIQSEVNKGSKFNIGLPTSVSIIDAMIVTINENKYATPLTSLEEIVDIANLFTKENSQMINLRNSVIPVQALEDFLPQDTPTLKKNSASQKKVALICRKNHERIAFLVDKVIGQQQIVVRPLNQNLEGVFGFFGGTIFGDGEPGLILDLPQITNYYLEQVKPMEKSA
jgi:two-component system chemotaxis sensor kinase CheA